MSGQSKKQSALESVANVAVGFGIALWAQLTIFPLFGYNPPLRDNLQISALFTLVSLARSYCLRRIFNWIALGCPNLHPRKWKGAWKVSGSARKQRRYEKRRRKYVASLPKVDVHRWKD